MPTTVPIYHCGFCDRDLEVRPSEPGWTVLSVGGVKKWACPQCMREGTGALDDGPNFGR